MSPTTSQRTIRVRRLVPGITVDQLQDAAKFSAKPKRRSIFSSAKKNQSSADIPVCFLAEQNEHLVSTVTFGSAQEKSKATEHLEKTRKWSIDSDFLGVTVLRCPEDVDLDICAVHGLGGNAFDTWMGLTNMWLRDTLPRSPPFDRARTMTYGYDSTLINKKSNDRIKDWADDLLRQIGHIRTGAHERKRPILFICHSLGGIVAREAMVRLDRHSRQFDGIELELCGLIFLSTPHSGTTEADWNGFLLILSEMVLGVRPREIVNELKSFNTSSVDSEEDFTAMSDVPPFHCFCEGDKTFVAGKYRQIVTQASAGFYGRKADKILNVDHHQICKFDDPFSPAYINVLARLHKIRRADNVQEIIDSLRQPDPQSRIIALTGMGGIGKTEILLEVAFRLRNITNVFSIKPTDAISTELALLQIATSIGHELLSIRYKNADLASIWRTYGPDQRIHAFKTWLGHPDNQPSVFIVDDLDGFGDERLIAAALPSEAQIILYSTRDPTIMESLERQGKAYHIPDMSVDEMASLMNAVLRKSGSRITNHAITEVELEAIATIVSGHALGACRAITYILNVLSQTSDKPATTFIQTFSGSKWEARKRFIEYKPRFGLSIIETFNTSLERMQNHKEAAIKLLELMAFLSNINISLHSRDFFSVERPWLENLKTDLPDYEIFADGLDGQNEYLLELERVSIGVRPVIPGSLQIHPLWVECIQQRAEHGGRLRWLRQILTLCYESFSRTTQQHACVLPAFKENAIMIATRFDIPYRDLCGTDDMWTWLKSSLPEVDEGPSDLLAPSIRSDITTVSAFASANSDDDLNYPGGPSKLHEDAAVEVAVKQSEVAEPFTELTAKTTSLDAPQNPISSLHEQCKAATKAITSSNPGMMSEELTATLTHRYLRLLQTLKDIEEDEKSKATIPDHRIRCLEIYDMLVEMAPVFRSRNPKLADLLVKRKGVFVEMSNASGE
ncbi:MAG: hypothetical protein LQ338_001162 [Usnochroma carphineum]|nr:MAG: hypothetical protein LQ338_001162 [Usnochroma carphineum]